MSWILINLHIYRIIIKIILASLLQYYMHFPVLQIYECLIPFPPPPLAFIISGKPPSSFHHGIFIRGYHTVTTWYYWNSSTLHNILALDLLPIMLIVSLLGPINLILHSSHIDANSAFSDKNPNPG